MTIPSSSVTTTTTTTPMDTVDAMSRSEDDGTIRPTLPRRSSSLHKQVLIKLRPLPFQYVWDVWHSKPESHGIYRWTMLIDHVADIAAFYRTFNNLPWHRLQFKDTIHIFRSGVTPLWEDPQNRHGGSWLIRVRSENGRAVRLWEEICLLSCGGELQAAISHQHDHVLGVSFSPRQFFTHISIWTKNGDDAQSLKVMERAILRGLSPDLRPTSKAELSYRKHADTLFNAGIVAGFQSPDLSRLPMYPPLLHASSDIV
ncbi:hypothetical protein PV10_04690 [Exophiala mesophila]|uniref:Translation initiation factor eIF4E n=1 Tax=Exophiala mesophila TaxID=212818 RepID=A0A0D1ZI03_EXOME|nr:uncharacterized protein PV10_04690 [Exophiala mesophila]KIV93479.1 hypothetical protein PV10_04690 [Exophiala mesophila]